MGQQKNSNEANGTPKALKKNEKVGKRLMCGSIDRQRERLEKLQRKCKTSISSELKRRFSYSRKEIYSCLPKRQKEV